jgi:hypothetical protein
VDLFGNAAYLTAEVTDMGGAPPIKTGGSYPRNRNFIIEGEAPGAFLGAKLADAEVPLDLSNTCTASTRQEALAYFSQPRNLSDFEVLPVDCGEATMLQQKLGKPTPDWSGSFGTDVSVGDFDIRALAEYKFGLQRHDLSGAFRQSNALIGRNTPRTAEIASTMLNPASSAQERLDAATEWAREYRLPLIHLSRCRRCPCLPSLLRSLRPSSLCIRLLAALFLSHCPLSPFPFPPFFSFLFFSSSLFLFNIRSHNVIISCFCKLIFRRNWPGRFYLQYLHMEHLCLYKFGELKFLPYNFL